MQQDDADHETRPDLRFEVTVHPGDAGTPMSHVADLDLDRVPDPEGGVRLLATAHECAVLVDEGYEVRLHRTLSGAPAATVETSGDDADEDSVRTWLGERTRGVPRAQGS
jgi:hypothetical protein